MTTERDLEIRIEQLEGDRELLIEALAFYANPETYHAIMIMADRPSGEFADDFDDEHGVEFYDRPMAGKCAREALRQLGEI